uniref:Bm11592 n=1 Tax=Brugia malayi TaxID=6279 RepID=A0A1I9GA06_BRUMA|nr:Bm11592 [Brugia malayi]
MPAGLPPDSTIMCPWGRSKAHHFDEGKVVKGFSAGSRKGFLQPGDERRERGKKAK